MNHLVNVIKARRQAWRRIMKTEKLNCDYVDGFSDIKNELQHGFQAVLDNHSAEELDIEDKNILLDLSGVTYRFTAYGNRLFKAPILRSGKEIGYYALVYTDEGESIDDVFFIYSPEALHRIADDHNWDDGIAELQWIVENSFCSEATAVMIFWRAQPDDYLEYSLDEDLDEVFGLIKTVMEKYQNGFYMKTAIEYNPKDDMPADENIPDIMFEETEGEEPYIYYEHKDVGFGEYLESQIRRCDNSIDLYNIAYLLTGHCFFNNYEKILAHKHCDKGIALMVFWKLKQGCYVFDEEKIISKIKNNEYKEIIKFIPKDHIAAKEIKWEPPADFKRKVGGF
jgi:hypothetical protein